MINEIRKMRDGSKKLIIKKQAMLGLVIHRLKIYKKNKIFDDFFIEVKKIY